MPTHPWKLRKGARGHGLLDSCQQCLEENVFTQETGCLTRDGYIWCTWWRCTDTHYSSLFSFHTHWYELQICFSNWEIIRAVHTTDGNMVPCSQNWISWGLNHNLGFSVRWPEQREATRFHVDLLECPISRQLMNWHLLQALWVSWAREEFSKASWI